jgi:hypothetical protein
VSILSHHKSANRRRIYLRSVVVQKSFSLKPLQQPRAEEDEEGQNHQYYDSVGQRLGTEGSETAKSVSPKKTGSSNFVGADGLANKPLGMRSSVMSSKTRTSMTRQSSKLTINGGASLAISNPCNSRKVAYNFDKNCERRALIDSHVDIDLSLLMLTSNTVSGFDRDSTIVFNQKTEGYMVGIATLRFKLKGLPHDGCFYLDFSGDEIYSFSVNGVEIPLEDLNWNENQILLAGLKKGSIRTHL